MNREGRTVQVGEDETLLHVLRRDAEKVPSSCDAGNCRTSKVRMTSRRVEQLSARLLEAVKDEDMP